MKNKVNKILIIFVIAISVVIIYFIYNYIFNLKGRLNQGNFRINDFVIKSSAIVTDNLTNQNNANNNSKDLSGVILNVSQDNNVSILISKNSDVEADSIYLDGFEVKSPNKKGKMQIYQADSNQKYDLTQAQLSIPINLMTTSDSQYLINLYINNDAALSNVKVPENTKNITYDGTVFKLFNVSLKDLQFYVKFNLNIKERTGKVNTVTIKMNIPDQTFIDKGISAVRQDTNNYNFIIQK